MNKHAALLALGASETVDALRAGETNAPDLVDALDAHISQVDPLLNALPVLCMDRAADAARALQAKPVADRGVLCGLPIPIKDLNPVKGVRTTFGSKVFENHVPPESDIVVQTIERNGGVVYAKSNTPEFGAGGNTFNDVFGITRNPFDLSLTPGGSSGGAAVALATRMAWLAHGSDMAGSLRTPASFCGVTSLRPSPGLIAAGPALLPFEVLGQSGPMARNIEDLGLFLDAMTGVHAHAALAKHAPAVSYRSAAREPMRPKKIAFTPDFGETRVESEVVAICRRAVDALAGDGTTVVEAHPDLGDAHFAFDVLRAVAYASGLGPDLEKNRHLLKPEVVWNVEQGLNYSGEQISSAMLAQGRVFKNMALFLDDYDLLVAPAVSQMPMPVEDRYPGFLNGLEIPSYYRWLAIAYVVTTATQPVVTLPCGVTSTGLPVGLQIIAKAHHEHDLLSMAAHLEQVFDWRAPAFDPAVAAAL